MPRGLSFAEPIDMTTHDLTQSRRGTRSGVPTPSVFDRTGESPFASARVAGLLYLVIITLGIFAEVVVRSRLPAREQDPLSLLAAAFRLTQTAIIGLNLLNMFGALLILRDADYLGPVRPRRVGCSRAADARPPQVRLHPGADVLRRQHAGHRLPGAAFACRA